MRRLIVLAAAALLVLALVPMASAATTSTTTKHVDGTVKVFEPSRPGVPNARYWLARFEVRTSPDGATVHFGYMHLYGITPGNNAGAIHEFSVSKVDYSRTAAGQRATLHMEECIIIGEPLPVPPSQCFPSNYRVSDGSPDTFNPVGLTGTEAWSVYSGNISIYTTSGQNSQ